MTVSATPLKAAKELMYTDIFLEKGRRKGKKGGSNTKQSYGTEKKLPCHFQSPKQRCAHLQMCKNTSVEPFQISLKRIISFSFQATKPCVSFSWPSTYPASFCSYLYLPMVYKQLGIPDTSLCAWPRWVECPVCSRFSVSICVIDIWGHLVIHRTALWLAQA